MPEKGLRSQQNLTVTLGWLNTEKEFWNDNSKIIQKLDQGSEFPNTSFVSLLQLGQDQRHISWEHESRPYEITSDQSQVLGKNRPQPGPKQ